MDPFDTLTCCALVGRLAAALAASVDPSVVLSSRLAVRPPGWRIEALRSGLTAEIDLVRVVETPTGERIDDVNALIDILEDATIILEETGTTSIAGFDARVVDVTAEANPRPRTEDVILRFSTSGDGGFVPPAEGRFWILDSAALGIDLQRRLGSGPTGQDGDPRRSLAG